MSLVRSLASGTGRSLKRAMATGVVLMTTLAATAAFSGGEPAEPIDISGDTFKCLDNMVKVRHFYVDNLLGNLEGTVAVAEKGQGTYPVGSVVQLIPGEVMVKQPQGVSPITKDWEFFELNVDKDGSKIHKRGFVDVNNQFGGNCFACHVKARPEFDFVCEIGHGCDPIPITRRMLAAVQKTDPRCPNPEPLTEDDNAALAELGEVLKTFTMPSGPGK